jgi:hypothetical protein
VYKTSWAKYFINFEVPRKLVFIILVNNYILSATLDWFKWIIQIQFLNIILLQGEELTEYIASILGDARLDFKTLIPLTSIYL